MFFLLSSALSWADVISSRKVIFKPSGLASPFKSLLPEKKIKEELPEFEIPESVIAIAPPNIQIKGIVWGGAFPQAIINDQVLREGDALEDPETITILEIKPQEVVVLFKGKIFSLYP